MVPLLYFLLASGDLFLRKLIKVLPTFKDKKRQSRSPKIESNISTYLFTVTLINVGVGCGRGSRSSAAGDARTRFFGA